MRKTATICCTLAVLALALPARAQDQGLVLWGKVFQVFSHPRCVNCHVGADNVPIWSGPSYGPKPRPHGMDINAGPSRNGAETIACGACHTQHNAATPHGPPGAEGWMLAPVTMQWFGKSSAEVCAQIKDPARNGGRQTITEIAAHVDDAGLVRWGWAPGPGREPAPYSDAQLVEFLKQWEAAGTPCPAP